MAGFRICPAQDLQRFVHEACVALGAEQDIAAEVAHHLVRANLSGHDSHGVLRLPWYAAQIEEAKLDPGARPEVIRETAATVLIDAHRGFGQYTTMVGLEQAMSRARQYGIGAAAIRHSTHIGRLGEYSERATDQGLVAIVTVGSTGRNAGIVVPFGGRERFLGTNPWSIGVPARDHTPLIFDAATSAIAEGKVRVARSKRVPLPEGCIIAPDGQASVEPEDFYAGGALLPMGGAGGGHKGYSLALASAMVGALAMIDDDEAVAASGAALANGVDDRGRVGGVFVIAIDPAAFGASDRYAAKVGEALSVANEITPASGVAAVLTPGEPEERSRAQREREGIPLPEAIWQDLAGVAARYNVSLPEHRAE